MMDSNHRGFRNRVTAGLFQPLRQPRIILRLNSCDYRGIDDVFFLRPAGLQETIRGHLHLVWVEGFEPPASWFQARNSDQTELHPDNLAPRQGLEPWTSDLTGRRSTILSYRGILFYRRRESNPHAFGRRV